MERAMSGAETLVLKLSYALTLVDPTGLTPAIDLTFWIIAVPAGLVITLLCLMMFPDAP